MGQSSESENVTSQLDKFKGAARELECDDARFDERVRRLVKHKPMPEKHERRGA